MTTNNSNISDIELYAMLNQGKSQRELAFTELYNRHSQRIYQYCRRISGNDEIASDVLQETYLRLLNSKNEANDMKNIAAYLLRIARNLCLDNKKKNNNNGNYEISEIPSYDTSLEIKELKELLIMTLELLPEEQKEVIVLQTYNGLSYQEISEFTNLPISTVRNWIVRGKKKMREILTPYIKELEL